MNVVYGLVAEFPGAAALLRAARAAGAAGYRRIDAYSPMPVEGLADALGHRRDRIPLFALAGGIAGSAGTFAMQWYSAAIAYPLVIGGRTPAWPGLIPATFEMTVLGAALCAFFGMLFLNGLPRLRHPIFDAPGFERASRDGFFLCIEARDSRFDATRTRQFLDGLQPRAVAEVPCQ
ncbi:MAG: DUF3341 domain-containing protein [Sulfuricella sp.]|nr:DUF3341 domain-containing protein [Sulfuricella sp.]